MLNYETQIFNILFDEKFKKYVIKNFNKLAYQYKFRNNKTSRQMIELIENEIRTYLEIVNYYEDRKLYFVVDMDFFQIRDSLKDNKVVYRILRNKIEEDKIKQTSLFE